MSHLDVLGRNYRYSVILHDLYLSPMRSFLMNERRFVGKLRRLGRVRLLDHISIDLQIGVCTQAQDRAAIISENVFLISPVPGAQVI